ncbi:glycerol-3-phosphate acyltransferase 2, mitochondrial, partial [Austrofundulus limnaeus]|uniref:Glycerol-3-phosphate acyltransferase 2, mitochondrial n=1 Tax=Austrofundulus limnaeus TaxID=52670 RepID=A0A2I4AR72_AUSLI
CDVCLHRFVEQLSDTEHLAICGLHEFNLLQDKLSWELKIKKKVKIVPSFLGKFRPAVGQCCHQCTPDSLRKKVGQNSFPGFRNLLSVNERQTRYRGWLVRRVCCALFVSGCKVYGSPASDRLERVCQSNRVKKALAADHKALEGKDSRGQFSLLSKFLPLINTCVSPRLLRFLSWVILKLFASVFGSIQVNLNHLPALHKASQEGTPLVYVYVRQNAMDCSLIPLVLFCHSLRVPYTLCPLQVQSCFLRSLLQKIGVVLLPPSMTELEAEGDPLYSAVMTSLIRELLHEGQVLSVGVSAESGLCGRWLARIRQLIKEGSVPDVSLVPVGISYDCVTKTNVQVGLRSVLLQLLSTFWKKPEGSVRIDLAQPFSLKEMCESGRCRVDEWLPLQDLLLPVILNDRSNSVFGKRRMSWLLPLNASDHEEMSPSDQDLSIAVILHLLFLTTSSLAVMSTSLVSSLLLYRHHKGVSMSVLCRDVAWLTEEVLFRNRDVGFGGSIPEVVHYSLTLLAPHLIISAFPSRKDPHIVPRPSSTLHLTIQAQTVVHAFILEAVGACAVSAMLCEVVFTGVSSRVRTDGVKGEEVKGDMEFNVVLGQSELVEKALQLCHLLPPGVMPPCQSSQSFALDAVDSLVRCGILVMEEVSRDVPICDFMKREGTLVWTTTDDPYHSDSDCEEPESRSYKISQPSQCPDMLFFLCSMLAGHLRALCWTIKALDLMDAPVAEAEFVSGVRSHLCDTANQKKQHYESCSEEAVHTAVRTLIDLGVLSEKRQTGGDFLGVSPLFQMSENREKLHHFISQYLYN